MNLLKATITKDAADELVAALERKSPRDGIFEDANLEEGCYQWVARCRAIIRILESPDGLWDISYYGVLHGRMEDLSLADVAVACRGSVQATAIDDRRKIGRAIEDRLNCLKASTEEKVALLEFAEALDVLIPQAPDEEMPAPSIY